nr:MAG TPA: hypothetical protein [Caudoviricetes sp.]
MQLFYTIEYTQTQTIVYNHIEKHQYNIGMIAFINNP